MAYPDPVPALKGKAARGMAEALKKSRRSAKKNPRWLGSRETFNKLRADDSSE